MVSLWDLRGTRTRAVTSPAPQPSALAAGGWVPSPEILVFCFRFGGASTGVGVLVGVFFESSQPLAQDKELSDEPFRLPERVVFLVFVGCII